MFVCQSRHSGDLLHMPLKVKTSSVSIKSYILIVAETKAFICFIFYMLHHTLILARPCVGFVDGQLEKFPTKFAFGEPQRGS